MCRAQNRTRNRAARDAASGSSTSVTATALALLRDDQVAAVVRLPEHRGRVLKVEGLTVLEAAAQQATLLAVTDVDDPDAASWTARIRVRL